MTNSTLNMTEIKIRTKMSHATSQSTLDNLDEAARLLYIEGILDDEEYDRLHTYWCHHWFNEKTGLIETLNCWTEEE